MSSTQAFTIGSLFSGIGGFDLAAERVWGPGCVRWQVENDPFACRVLAKHWPDVERYGDIREVTGDELEPVDLVCGGFPCQPVSVAGLRRAENDPRWLWPEMARLVAALRPPWVVGENVPGLLRLGLDAVCADLERLGYTVGTLGIPAVAVGAPHLRERLWIVAYAESEGQSRRGVRRRTTTLGEAPDDGASNGSEAVADTYRAGLAVWESVSRDDGSQRSPAIGGGWWPVEPGVRRMVDGVPARVDRLRALGNAVVPQVAEFIFRRIAEAAA
jgi:DNA (cytosine-5)-methyltransferase 1